MEKKNINDKFQAARCVLTGHLHPHLSLELSKVRRSRRPVVMILSALTLPVQMAFWGRVKHGALYI